MTKLNELAALVRSKNAKPFLLTIDIMFDNADAYYKVKRSKVITTKVISSLYKVDESNIMFIEYDEGLAFKITFPRPIVEGDPEDSDIYGGQQHSPLLELDIS